MDRCPVLAVIHPHGIALNAITSSEKPLLSAIRSIAPAPN
jgi:hypothetical protein